MSINELKRLMNLKKLERERVGQQIKFRKKWINYFTVKRDKCINNYRTCGKISLVLLCFSVVSLLLHLDGFLFATIGSSAAFIVTSITQYIYAKKFQNAIDVIQNNCDKINKLCKLMLEDEYKLEKQIEILMQKELISFIENSSGEEQRTSTEKQIEGTTNLTI